MFRPGAVEFDLFETGELDVKPAHFGCTSTKPGFKGLQGQVKLNYKVRVSDVGETP
jgi:hypothetical protein